MSKTRKVLLSIFFPPYFIIIVPLVNWVGRVVDKAKMKLGAGRAAERARKQRDNRGGARKPIKPTFDK